MVSVPHAYVSERTYGVIGATITNSNIADGTIKGGIDYVNFLSTTGGTISNDLYVLGNVGIGTTSAGNNIVVSNGSVEIKVDNADNKLRFHDPWTVHYSLGIDRSETGKFNMAFGGNIGEAIHFIMNPDGNIGIKTLNPTVPLVVSIDSTCVSPTYWAGTSAGFVSNKTVSDWSQFDVISGNTGTAQFLFGDVDNASMGAVSYDNNSNMLSFYTNGTQQVTIDAAGSMGFGTASVGSGNIAEVNGVMRIGGKFEINYDVTQNDPGKLRIWYGYGLTPHTSCYYLDTSYQTYSKPTSATSYYFRVVRHGYNSTPSSLLAYLRGAAGWQSACTRTVKHDIVQLADEDYLNLRKQLDETQLFSYLRNDVPDKPEVGFISEETPAIMGSTGKGIIYIKSIGFLATIVKSQVQELDRKEEQISKLESLVSDLKQRVRRLEESR
jgi:hypothetical protein